MFKYSDKGYLSQLEARLERLEKEKLELVKVSLLGVSFMTAPKTVQCS